MPQASTQAAKTSTWGAKVPVSPGLLAALTLNSEQSKMDSQKRAGSEHQARTHTDNPALARPQLSDLPSTYAQTVHQHRDAALEYEPVNEHWLTCQECGRRGRYNLGSIAVHPGEYLTESVSSVTAASKGNKLKEFMANVAGHIQCTGYFRCKHCNAAGQWDFGDAFSRYLLTELLRALSPDPSENTSGSVGPGSGVNPTAIRTSERPEGFSDTSFVQIGRFRAFDGTEPAWATDAEQHLLDLIEEKPDDSYLWNRLGNVYHWGSMPELAVVAFETSLKYDSGQVESHAALAGLLYRTGQFGPCIDHSHLALAHARYYSKLDTASLRKLLCVVLHNLLDVTMFIGNTDMLLPPMELNESVAKEHGALFDAEKWRAAGGSFNLQLDDLDSFIPLAELYTGRSVRIHSTGAQRRPHAKKKKRR